MMLSPVQFLLDSSLCSILVLSSLMVATAARIKIAAGHTLQLACCPAEPTHTVMEQLWRRGWETEGQLLMLGSQRLEGAQSLSSSGVQEGCILKLAPADAADPYYISARVSHRLI